MTRQTYLGAFYSTSQIFIFPRNIIGLKFIPNESDLFRAIPEFFSKPFRVIPNQSEKHFVSRLTEKPSKINSTESEPSF